MTVDTRQRAPRDKALVLVVDDYEDGRDLMVDMLSLAGFDTLAAGSAAETIAIARQSSPDVILMDARLPEVDGFTTAQSLRDDPQTTHIPIVMVTAHATPEARELAEGAGCVGFVVKPFLPDDLIRAIERARRISSTTG